MPIYTTRRKKTIKGKTEKEKEENPRRIRVGGNYVCVRTYVRSLYRWHTEICRLHDFVDTYSSTRIVYIVLCTFDVVLLKSKEAKKKNMNREIH